MKKIIYLFERLYNKIRRELIILYFKTKYSDRITIGKNLQFRKRFKIIIGEKGKVSIGDNCFFNNDCSINCLEKIVIGNNNLFGENVKIYDHNHIFNKGEKDLREKFKTQPVIIKNNNWIGTNAVILKNASMEDRNVIGAGVVLDEKINSYNLVKLNNTNYNISKITLNK